MGEAYITSFVWFLTLILPEKGQFGQPIFFNGDIFKLNCLKCLKLKTTPPSMVTKFLNFIILNPAARKDILSQKPTGRSRVQRVLINGRMSLCTKSLLVNLCENIRLINE